LGKASRGKQLRHPQKIRTRTDAEIRETIMAYKNLFKIDPFIANMMLVISELSEYIPIDLKDEKKLRMFIEQNMDGLTFQFLRRFRSITEYALPWDPFAPQIFLIGDNRLN